MLLYINVFILFLLSPETAWLVRIIISEFQTTPCTAVSTSLTITSVTLRPDYPLGGWLGRVFFW